MNQVLYNPKIKPEHLARKAIVYLRQSSEKQVRHNKESQRLQYDVAERMRSLGWKAVEIIYVQLGQKVMRPNT
jgi:DNA invertase Pin-like site-specific DNA recombinase